MRAAFWDYGSCGTYFVTICIDDRPRCWFGNVKGGKVKLSAIGHVANSCWYEIPNHFRHVELGAHVIMPDHIHGIVIIHSRPVETPKLGVSGVDMVPLETPCRASLPGVDTEPLEEETPKLGVSTAAAAAKWYSGTLGVVINQFKRAVTIGAREINCDFKWQSRYHDRIVRDRDALDAITRYIVENPTRWSK